MTRLTHALALSLVLTACGPPPEPPAPPPLDPTGTWDVTVSMQGQQVNGVLMISGTEEAYTGSIDTEMGGASISNIVVTGRELTFTVPDAGVDVVLQFDGDTFTGSLDGAMGQGTIMGSKRR